MNKFERPNEPEKKPFIERIGDKTFVDGIEIKPYLERVEGKTFVNGVEIKPFSDSFPKESFIERIKRELEEKKKK